MLLSSAILFVLLSKLASSQDANCDYRLDVELGKPYYLYSPGYPEYYTSGFQCRWTITGPTNFNCKLNCSEINLPDSPECSVDKILISKTGDPQLSGADKYCGSRSLVAVSTENIATVGATASDNTPGGRFLCEVTAQPAAPSNNTCTCGYKKSNRIVGGKETEVNEFPMMAGIVNIGERLITGGAVIITPNSVLSAAHVVVNKDFTTLAVVVGEHDVTTGGDTNATKLYQIESIVIHPKYTPMTLDYDAAIINIRGVIMFSNLVGPVCLPFKYQSTNLTGKNVTALGWGSLNLADRASNTLQKVELNIISRITCRLSDLLLTERQLCTYTRGKDTCRLDGGGPLLLPDPQTGRVFAVGIISSSRCNSGTPSINTDVTEILNWILANAPYDYCVK